MRSPGVARWVAVAISTGLLVGLVASAPAQARKKKKRKPPQPPVCVVYTPGEQGAGLDVSVVTDAATEAAPFETTVSIDPGLALTGSEPTLSHAYGNIQIDSALPEIGLYARLEFAAYEDYALYLNLADGTERARSAGFNPASQFGDGTGYGGHSEMGAENLDGIRTPDCQGYTFHVAAYTGMGGDLPLKLWLGPEWTY